MVPFPCMKLHLGSAFKSVCSVLAFWCIFPQMWLSFAGVYGSLSMAVLHAEQSLQAGSGLFQQQYLQALLWKRLACYSSPSKERSIFFISVRCYLPILRGGGGGGRRSSEVKTSFKKAGFPEILDHEFWGIKRVLDTYIQYLLQNCFLEKVWKVFDVWGYCRTCV